jgi:hypothetical protein
MSGDHPVDALVHYENLVLLHMSTMQHLRGDVKARTRVPHHATEARAAVPELRNRRTLLISTIGTSDHRTTTRSDPLTHSM